MDTKSQQSQSSTCCRFSKAASAHRVNFPSEEISSSSTKLTGGEGWGALHVYCPLQRRRLGYGDMVWRVRVNRGKEVALHNLPNSTIGKFAFPDRDFLRCRRFKELFCELWNFNFEEEMKSRKLEVKIRGEQHNILLLSICKPGNWCKRLPNEAVI